MTESLEPIHSPAPAGNAPAAGKPTLVRNVFKTSRLAEFCSQKELVNQTGHAVEDWPLVVLKELLDNALDAAEEAGAAPAIEIAVSEDGICVIDNGPGIAPDTVADILDYTSRTSSREAYVSPKARRATRSRRFWPCHSPWTAK
jgi:signal transduction histidine kinase